MKRFKITILLILAVFVFPGLVFAVDGTLTGALITKGSDEHGAWMVVEYTATFSAGAVPPAAVALEDILTAGGKAMPPLGGWWLLDIAIYPGGTAPTANVDLRFWSVEDIIDLLGDNGLNSIDGAGSGNTVTPAVSTKLLSGTTVFDVDPSTENVVNNAVTTIRVTVYR